MIDSVIDAAIHKVPNFPKEGILYYDITSLLANPEAFSYCIDKMVERYKKAKFDAIASIESRGFLFAAPLAKAIQKPLILIRKAGKLPRETHSCKYKTEYGEAEIEVHKDDIKKGQKFLVIDDLLATGGTMKATKTVLEAGGASVYEYFGILGLPRLGYERVLAPTTAATLTQYDGQ